MNNLAKMYEDGMGVPVNPREALYWYGKAKKNGYDVNTKIINKLENEISVVKSKDKSVRQGAGINLVCSLALGLGLLIWYCIAVDDQYLDYSFSFVAIYFGAVIIPYILYLIYGARVSDKAIRNTGFMVITYIIEILAFTFGYILIKQSIINVGYCEGVFERSCLVVFVSFLIGVFGLNYGNYICAKKVNNPLALIVMSLITIFLYSMLVYTILLTVIEEMLMTVLLIFLIGVMIFVIGWNRLFEG